MSGPVAQHRADSPSVVSCAVITVSDTRSLDNDRGGSLVCELLESAGHLIAARELVRDEPREMQQIIRPLVDRPDVQAILLTGGTGISRRDVTHETITSLLDKHLPGYGELFRMLSYQEIGAAAMLSRAVSGIVDATLLFTMPGSPAAVRLAMEKLVLPELPHLVREATKQ